MASLKKYFQLLKQYPELFRNTGETGEIKIIKDRKRIREEQNKIREKLRAKGNPISWIDIGVISEDAWFWVVRDMVEFPGGNTGGYIRFINRKSQEGGFNVILMCVRNGQVLMIKRFRHEGRNWSWEFPRGFGEPGLTAEENARKELEEETGFKNARLTLLANVSEGQGGTSVYLAEIPSDEKLELESGEGIAEHRWIGFTELKQLVLQGQLNDWFSLWAYSLANVKHIV